MNSRVDVDYGRITHYIIIGLVAVAVLILNYCSLSEHMASNSQSVTDYSLPEDYVERNREPVVAGLFYPSRRQDLNQELDKYLVSKKEGTASLPPEILIVPHAGYEYSAAVAAKAYLTLQPFASKIHNVILVGPSHRVAFNGAALSGMGYFSTPLGKVKINRRISDELAAASPEIRVYDQAHALEHSLEVQIPFLQKILPDFEIVPLVYGEIAPETLAAALEPYLRRPDTIIVFSADLSHYYDYETAKKLDAETAGLVSRNEADVEEHLSCGAAGINTALILAKENKLIPEMMDMANSGDVKGILDNVVGYGSWKFSPGSGKKQNESALESDLKALTDFRMVHGKELMRVAERALAAAVIKQHQYTPSRKDYDNALFNKGASFVTLHEKEKLRGCIGSVMPKRGIARDVAENTYAAALEDNRFQPLTAENLADTKITVSLLTGFERIRYHDEADLLSKLKPGVDGVIIRDGNRQGLFLPSVWKELPDRQEFLNNLKLKAGMNPSFWSNKIKVYRFYTVEINQNAD